MASASTISIGVIVVLAFGAPAPADPAAVILFYWACMWIGFAFGLLMASVGRPFPYALRFLNMFLRFGLFLSGVMYTIDRLPYAWWPYLEWNPVLQAVEARAKRGCPTTSRRSSTSTIWSCPPSA